MGAFQFSVDEFWLADADISKERFEGNFWHAIPKPQIERPYYRTQQQLLHSSSTDAIALSIPTHESRRWVCSYARIERDLINGSYFMKPLIRIFKKIRDTHSITVLKSYYIKQIFIHQCMLKDPSYWEQSLGHLFKEMLDVIIERLIDRKLPFFWHKNLNLFNRFSRTQMKEMLMEFRRLRRELHIRCITRGPEYIYHVVLTDIERRQINPLEEECPIQTIPKKHKKKKFRSFRK